MLCGGRDGAWGSRKREQGGLFVGQHLRHRGLAIGQGGQIDGSGQKTGGAGLGGCVAEAMSLARSSERDKKWDRRTLSPRCHVRTWPRWRKANK